MSAAVCCGAFHRNAEQLSNLFLSGDAGIGSACAYYTGYVFAGVLTVIGLIKAVGHIIDAFSDPIVASISDKCKHKSGRRIPFIKWFAVPFALSALLIFWSPFENPVFNNIWLAVFIWLYYICYTFYMLPQNALHIKNFSAISCIAVYFACRNGRTHINRDLPLCFVAFCRNMHIMKCTQ